MSNTKIVIIVAIGIIILIGVASQNKEIKKEENPLEGIRSPSMDAPVGAGLSPKAKKLKEKYPLWSDTACETVAEKKISLGMTEGQVRASWGKPPGGINRTVTQRGVHEQWVYGDTYLYLIDGFLTSWQERK